MPTLNFSHVAAVNATPVGELFLGPAFFLAELPDARLLIKSLGGGWDPEAPVELPAFDAARERVG